MCNILIFLWQENMCNPDMSETKQKCLRVMKCRCYWYYCHLYLCLAGKFQSKKILGRPEKRKQMYWTKVKRWFHIKQSQLISLETQYSWHPLIAICNGNMMKSGVFASNNKDMIMRDAMVDGFGNSNHLVLFDVHLNLSKWTSRISASIKNGAAADGIRSCDLHISSRAP